jgi:hypothetical protein
VVKKVCHLIFQTSGRPEICPNDDDDLRNFIKQVDKRGGLSLGFDDFSWTPQIQQVSKLHINSLWGRFGLRQNIPRQLFASWGKDVFFFLILNEISTKAMKKYALGITYKKSPNFLDINNGTNI